MPDSKRAFRLRDLWVSSFFLLLLFLSYVTLSSVLFLYIGLGRISSLVVVVVVDSDDMDEREIGRS